jgi:hypothetical protein
MISLPVLAVVMVAAIAGVPVSANRMSVDALVTARYCSPPGFSSSDSEATRRSRGVASYDEPPSGIPSSRNARLLL